MDSPVGQSDHVFLTIHPNNYVTNSNISEFVHDVPVYDFRLSNINALRLSLLEHDWSSMINEKDINRKWKVFQQTLLFYIDKTIPKQFVTMSSTDKEWITPLTKLLINERWLAYRQGDWKKYQHLSQKVKYEIGKCKTIWANKIKSKQNGIWALMSAMTQNNTENCFDSLINRNGGLEKTLSDIANQFCSSSGPSMQNDVITYDDEWTITVLENDVKNQLSKINPKKFSGDPHVSSFLYQKLSEVIAYPLTHIFKTAIMTRNVPQDWKNTVITPIPKEKPVQISRLRPLSQSLLPAKIFERVLLK